MRSLWETVLSPKTPIKSVISHLWPSPLQAPHPWPAWTCPWPASWAPSRWCARPRSRQTLGRFASTPPPPSRRTWCGKPTEKVFMKTKVIKDSVRFYHELDKVNVAVLVLVVTSENVLLHARCILSWQGLHGEQSGFRCLPNFAPFRAFSWILFCEFCHQDVVPKTLKIPLWPPPLIFHWGERFVLSDQIKSGSWIWKYEIDWRTSWLYWNSDMLNIVPGFCKVGDIVIPQLRLAMSATHSEKAAINNKAISSLVHSITRQRWTF